MFCRKSPLSTQLCRRLLRICVDRIYIFCQHKSCQFRKSSSTKRYSVNTNTPKSPLKRNQISRRRIVRISRVKEHHILWKEPNILSKTNFKKSLLKRKQLFRRQMIGTSFLVVQILKNHLITELTRVNHYRSNVWEFLLFRRRIIRIDRGTNSQKSPRYSID